MQSKNPPYTAEEKQWLKDNYKNEFQFLRIYGYSIYDEEERAEGRELVRAFMKPERELEDERDDDSPGDTGEIDSDNDSMSSVQSELDKVPESHFADFHFSAD